ncbi:MAG: hypothetical protein ACLPWO_07340 [Thermoplasmata archaeon]
MSDRTRTAAFVTAVIVALIVSILLPSGAVAARSTHNASAPLDSIGGTPSTRNYSSHPGNITYYDVAPGGATSVDPSVAYDTISEEPILNVYQTLVAYDGNNTSSFVPQLSLCVPGPGCAAMYGGETLIVNSATTGSPQYFTFPIDPAARYYDPSTGANWSVYPSDVAFTFARTCGFANLPGFGSQPGWIQCQALLAYGNPSWDSGIHYVFNNTPEKVLSAMLINDSAYCPPAALAENGCVTFDAAGGGTFWSFFLQLVADPLGASIEPCGWFSYQGAGVPGFAGTTAASGDGPCLLPGGAHATTDSAFQSWMSTFPITGWDTFEELALNTPGIQPHVQWNMVGSGPYYLVSSGGQHPFAQSVGYTLEQNPAYHQPTGCGGQPNCEPLPGPSHYMAKINVIYEQNDTVGIDQYASGQADFATILPAEVPRMLQIMQQGKIGLLTVPNLFIYLLAFALTFSPSAAKTIDPNPLNVPGDFFNYVGLRQFLVNAFPYTTVENTIFTTDGIQYGVNYGGVIPRHMGNYYPTNISWPSGDPVSNASVNGSAAWWWAQATSPSSPYYDDELASCTTSSPCQFPFIGQQGAVVVDQLIQDYLPYISQLSGGRLAPNTFDCSFASCDNCLIFGCGPAGPGDSVTPAYNLGWAPDYPDPTDYVAPFYYANATYTSGDDVQAALSLFTCTNTGPIPSGSAAGLLYWSTHPIPQACQGNAYGAMEWGMNTAAGMAVGPARVLMYNMVEHIANDLALYVYYDQSNVLATYASWISASSVNTNPMIGGSGDFLWYNVRYVPRVYPVTFTETGLPLGTNWTVTLNDTSNASTTYNITFTEPNGTYPFSVGSVAGYVASESSGMVLVNGSRTNDTVPFTSSAASSGSSFPLSWAKDAYVVYGVIAVGVAVAAVLLLRRRRAPPLPVSPPPTPGSGSPPAPP